jgi:hypothetical protein
MRFRRRGGYARWTVRPYWLGPPPTRVARVRLVGQSGAVATRSGLCVGPTASSGVFGVRFDAPACDRPIARAHHFTRKHALIRRGHCGPIRLRRSARSHPATPSPRSCGPRMRDGRADASLEVPVPFSALLPRRATAGRRHLPACPAPTLAALPVLLRPSRASCDQWLSPSSHDAVCTHAPARRLLVPAVFCAETEQPVNFARPDVARLDPDGSASLDAPLHRTRRCRRGSCAARYLRDDVPLPIGAVHVAWSGPLSAAKLAWVSVP